MQNLKDRNFRFLVALFVLGIWFTGCDEPRETPTKGELTVYSDEAYFAAVSEIADTFNILYPQASVVVIETSAREGITKVLNGESEIYVSSRRLNSEEEQFVRVNKLDLKSIKLCYDGVVFVQNAADTITLLSFDSFRSLASGKRKMKSESLFVSGVNSGVTELLSDSLNLSRDSLFVSYLKNDNEVLAAAARRKGNYGFTGYLPFKLSKEKVKSSKIGLREQTGTKDVYFEPHPGFFVQQIYPLTRLGVVILNEVNIGLASGFATFLTGNIGQKMILDAGLAPAAVPVRLRQ